ncbi:hypothetical protein F3Y22_tig00112912pilonHSYRG00055 [Hibiscus syriacus]|uniref:Protease Do-like PDZ domain-containing protein n=1 Tax=Hibiscus syriacus TaxID=106335 RepID=A0A6A2WT00_HIBSY|nr:hypothetical protein F3Y22_tig00112912pilonHSYRG00055 [Hibiscus syriacus]
MFGITFAGSDRKVRSLSCFVLEVLGMFSLKGWGGARDSYMLEERFFYVLEVGFGAVVGAEAEGGSGVHVRVYRAVLLRNAQVVSGAQEGGVGVSCTALEGIETGILSASFKHSKESKSSFPEQGADNICSFAAVPVHQFDKLPSYYIFAGLVFVPLTQPYLHEHGEDWYNTPPRRLCERAIRELPKKAGEQLVILSQVLMDDIKHCNHRPFSMDVRFGALGIVFCCPGFAIAISVRVDVVEEAFSVGLVVIF